jgi:hypothetical protein
VAFSYQATVKPDEIVTAYRECILVTKMNEELTLQKDRMLKIPEFAALTRDMVELQLKQKKVDEEARTLKQQLKNLNAELERDPKQSLMKKNFESIHAEIDKTKAKLKEEVAVYHMANRISADTTFEALLLRYFSEFYSSGLLFYLQQL